MRLVAQHMQTKEIARKLHLTPNTVNTYIKSACGRLGVQSRREAATRLLAYEGKLRERTQPLPAETPCPEPLPILRHPLLRPIVALEHPSPSLHLVLRALGVAISLLAAFMVLEAVIVALHNAMHPELQVPAGHRLADALPHGRQTLSTVLLTGRPTVRLLLAVSFVGPAVGLMVGGAALRLASLTMAALVFANICVRFSPTTTTVADALQLAAYACLLGLTRQHWARVLIGLQSAILVADIAFHIQGIIDNRTWEMVQLVGVTAMVPVILWGAFEKRRSRRTPAQRFYQPAASRNTTR